MHANIHRMGGIGRRTLFLTIIVVMVGSLFTYISSSQASTLTSLSVTLGETKPSAAGNMRVAFTTVTQLSGDSTNSDDDAMIILRLPQVAGGDPFAISGSLVASDISLVSGFPANVTVNSIAVSNAGGSAANDTITIRLNMTNAGSAININASTALVFDILNDRIINPAKVASGGTADLYDFSIATRANDGSTDIDNGATRLAIQDATTGSATVDTTLAFTVAGVNTGNPCRDGRNNSTGVNSTATTIPFGTLAPNMDKVTCQTLTISTNAPNGYLLYVVQNQNLTSGSDDIDQFLDGVRVDDLSAVAWADPQVNVGNEASHGHIGYGTTDPSVFPNAATYAGIPTSATVAGTTPPVTTGLACDNAAAVQSQVCTVEYRVEVSALQPAGSYSNEIQYLLVPRY
jgi:hypothetical protein